ncbi:MAG: hypothetical protein N2560_08855 [Ignavibacteria bacterium]|nr:hypothetical protein [Ignavibacteria bacterium]
MIEIAKYGLITILSGLIIFHLLVLLKVIPYDIVWGSRVKSEKDLFRLEMISLLINLFFLFSTLIYVIALPLKFPKIIMTIILWTMVALFGLNTLGNVLSKNKLEQRLFAPLTVLLTLFSLIMVLNN